MNYREYNTIPMTVSINSRLFIYRDQQKILLRISIGEGRIHLVITPLRVNMVFILKVCVINRENIIFLD